MNPEIDYSVIIPAYNEEQVLQETLKRLISSMETEKRKGEVIVVDNNSTDQTALIAKKMDVMVVFEPLNQISRARNAGARLAQGPLLIFLDADTKPTAQLISQALDWLETKEGEVGGVLLSFGARERGLAQTMRKLFNWLALRLKMAPGCFLFCTKKAFEQVGGFSEKVYCSEEIWFVEKVKKWAHAQDKAFYLITDPHVETSSRKFDYPGSVFITFALGILMPFTIFFRSFCGLWYRRKPRRSDYY